MIVKMNANKSSKDQMQIKGNPAYNKIAGQYLYGRKPQYGYLVGTGTYLPVPASNSTEFFPKGTPITKVDEGPQTVEQLVNEGYFSMPAGDPEIALISDKKHTSWMGLDDVIGQIRQRKDIYEKNMTEIEWSKCYATNDLTRGGWPPTNEQENVYSTRLQDLHSQQRAERIAFWKDVSRLRLALPESAQQYLSASRKVDILKDYGGDMK